MNKKVISIFLIIVLISGIGVYKLYTYQYHKPLKEVTVIKGTITEKVFALGNITPLELIEVKSPIAGTAAKLFHHIGEHVVKGDSLLAVKPTPTPDLYASAYQQVQIDKVALLNAQIDLKRYIFLSKNGGISNTDQDFAKAKKTYQIAQLTLELDQEKLSLLDNGNAVIGGHPIANIIKSPVDGYIIQQHINTGAPVVAQSNAQMGNTLFIITNMKHLIFKGEVSEVNIPKIHKNMWATIKVAAYPTASIKGKLTQIALQSTQSTPTTIPTTNNNANTYSPSSVSYQIKITHLQIPKQVHLLAGYSAKAYITIKTVKDGLLIPKQLLKFDDNKTYVWILGKNGRLIKHYVTVGLSDDKYIQIIQGLKLGDKIHDFFQKAY